MRSALGASVVTAILASVAILALPAVSSAARLPGLLTGMGGRHPFDVRPAVVNYTGDASGFLGGFDGGKASDRFGHMIWSSWTGTVAVGSGAVWLDTCEPDCAQGVFVPYAVRVRAFAPRDGHFTRLTLRFDAGGDAIIDERGISALRAPGTGPSSEFYEYFIVHYSSSPLPTG
jgi:hypothetical protein